jgi:hypothetical protein
VKVLKSLGRPDSVEDESEDLPMPFETRVCGTTDIAETYTLLIIMVKRPSVSYATLGTFCMDVFRDAVVCALLCGET